MSKIVRYLVSLLEILGGVFGIALMFLALPATHINTATLIIYAITVAINLFSIFAGVRLYKDKRGGRASSIIVQALQIPKIITPGFIFMFSIGLDFWVNILMVKGNAIASFQFKSPAYSQIFVGPSGAPLGIGISFTSVVFLLLLIKYGSDEKLEFVNARPPDQSRYKTSYS